MSPLVQDYDLYADESFLCGPVAFAFGALICTPRRAEILGALLAQLRATTGYSSEVKWSKTSRETFPIHRAFVDAFFDDRFARCSILQAVKGHAWHKWANTDEERFFKSYYVFLMRNAGPFSRYRVFLDTKPLQKPYRWTTLHYLVNRSRRYNWDLRRRNIRFLDPIDSHSSDLLQVADLLLGCATSGAESDAKRALREHFAVRRAAAQPKRVRVESWSPVGRQTSG